MASSSANIVDSPPDMLDGIPHDELEELLDDVLSHREQPGHSDGGDSDVKPSKKRKDLCKLCGEPRVNADHTGMGWCAAAKRDPSGKTPRFQTFSARTSGADKVSRADQLARIDKDADAGRPVSDHDACALVEAVRTGDAKAVVEAVGARGQHANLLLMKVASEEKGQSGVSKWRSSLLAFAIEKLGGAGTAEEQASREEVFTALLRLYVKYLPNLAWLDRREAEGGVQWESPLPVHSHSYGTVLHVAVTHGSLFVLEQLKEKLKVQFDELLFKRTKNGWLPLHQLLNKDSRGGDLDGELCVRLIGWMREARPGDELGQPPQGFEAHARATHGELVARYAK